MQTGNIGVTTENIFPVIKKFLYSDEEIFIREIISNAVDACQKLKVLASTGDYNGNVDDLKVSVKISDVDNTITVSDNGIGMTAEEIDKYINQIAFSGAEEFINKFKTDDANIIGHFGLGFYSSYIVSNTVEIITKSYKEDAVAQHWTCDGSPAYTLEDTEKETIGTDIVMHISPEFIESYINEDKVKHLLIKYSRFLPIPIYLYGPDKKEVDASTNVETITPGTETKITSVEPLWVRKPSEIKDEEYLEFYRTLYPGLDDPLFWIHLNVDFPFNLTGILYFPKVTGNVDIMRDKVYLYSNQVYVTDHVNNILPDYLTLLNGVIDSPDIPLNVSRSYLQSDANVKQISGYISNKVASELTSRINADRAEYEKKWPSMKIFMHYGVLTQKGFYEKVRNAILLEDTDGKYYTYSEYTDIIKDTQKNPDNKIVYLYATDKVTQYSYIETAKNKGYSVIEMTDNLSTPLINLFEREEADSNWVRVDSDVISNLIKTDEVKSEVKLSEADKELVLGLFNEKLPELDESELTTTIEALGEDALPVIITANEWTRRVKEMYSAQPGMSFNGLKYAFNVNVNSDAPIIQTLINKFNKKSGAKYEEINNAIIEQEKVVNDLKDKAAKLKETEKDSSDNADAAAFNVDAPIEIDPAETEKLDKLKEDKKNLIINFAKTSDLVEELIDIALLQTNMLTGEKLNNYLKRTVKMLK